MRSRTSGGWGLGALLGLTGWAGMSAAGAAGNALPTPVALNGDWQLQDAAKVPAGGGAVSETGYRPARWYRATVPGTVLTSLVNDGVYPEPLYGENNRPDRIPDSLCRATYWYRTTFRVHKSGIAKNAREEKIRARDLKIKQDAENARMAKLYRKEILQEPDAPAGFISIGEIKPAAPVASKIEVVQQIEETVAGDWGFARVTHASRRTPDTVTTMKPPAMAALIVEALTSQGASPSFEHETS